MTTETLLDRAFSDKAWAIAAGIKDSTYRSWRARRHNLKERTVEKILNLYGYTKHKTLWVRK